AASVQRVSIPHTLLWPVHGGRLSAAHCCVGVRGGQRVFRPDHCAAVHGVARFDFSRGFRFERHLNRNRHSTHSSWGGGGGSMERCAVRNAGVCGGGRLCSPPKPPGFCSTPHL